MISTDLNLAIQSLNNNDIVAIPTETVYGLAGNAYSINAVEKIFSLKKRPHYNPLIVHIKSVDFLSQVAYDVPELAIQLANKFWPGPLTLVLKKQPIIPDIVTSGKDTVAVRVPNHPITLKLLQQLDFPLAAPSANPFASISPTNASHVSNYFKDELEVILDGGECEKGLESTIIGFKDQQAVLYRLGSISVEDIKKVVGNLIVNSHNDVSPEAPGMLSRHYAPSTDTYLTHDVKGLLHAYQHKKVGLLLFKDNIKEFGHIHQEILSISGDMNEAAKNLYAAMHRLDKLGLDMIIAERLPNMGLGATINDKLERATKK